jgi:hypothetical protein
MFISIRFQPFHTHAFVNAHAYGDDWRKIAISLTMPCCLSAKAKVCEDEADERANCRKERGQGEK